MNYFYSQWDMFIYFPHLTLVPGCLLMLCFAYMRYQATGRSTAVSIVLVSVIGWFFYGFYETIVYFVSLENVPPLRVDILFIGPFLYIMTIVALIAFIDSVRAPNA